MLRKVIDKSPGLMLEKDGSNENVLTYVDLQRGGREKAVV
jgi:hypothetical protein